jgi:hypothetical protein
LAKKPESRLQRQIRKGLKAEVGGWWRKIHGGPFQAAGIPDLLGCVEGHFIGLEVKHPDQNAEVSELQLKNIREIRRNGGTAEVVESLEEALSFVREALAKAKGSRRVRTRTTKRRAVR